jgi:hypothetical protein
MKDYRGFWKRQLFISIQPLVEGTIPPKPPEFISAQTPILLSDATTPHNFVAVL